MKSLSSVSATGVAFLLLLSLPSWALSRLSPRINGLVLIGAPLVASGLAFFLYRHDKRRAVAGQWRTPEWILHLAALGGGWPGAFLAQRTFRHKTAKVSFQLVFWAIVLLHQFVALDSLLGWRITKSFF